MRRVLTILVLMLAVWTRSARASSVGVVVTGDSAMQSQVRALVEGWLRANGHSVLPAPFTPDATNKLIDCIVLEDTSCARKIVETHATTSAVVFARVEVTGGPAGARDMVLTGYWFERGSEPVAEKRMCDKCSDTALVTAGDELMTALAGSKLKTVGQLHITSSPSGAQVVIDGADSGVTPLDVALAPGDHKVTISSDGHLDDARSVTIVQGKPTTLEITLSVVPPTPPFVAGRSKLPLVAIGGGGALVLVGIVLFATSETDTGEKPEYRDTRALGIGVAIGGAALAAVGAYLWFTSKPADSAPTVSLVPGGATLGWGRTF
ncbi:MAG: PEGA domain-containing protein [Deltaproteobacteria bacterium]|nr:PEGA domain-containing protein [Deltaproteobacteria bacterium]